MNIKAILMILVAAATGLIAVVLAANWLTQQNKLSTAKVVVAVNDLDLGTRLTPDMLKVIDWPRAGIPPGAFDNLKTLDSRVLKTNLTRGEPILESKLAPAGTKGGLSAVIGEGHRAITVKVNEVMGVAGFALPGNYVDILVNTENNNKKPISKIVLEHILVLAVAQEASRDDTKPKVVNAVTLEVSPEQAEKLDLARSVGTLSLVLRNQMDKRPVLTAGAMRDRLLNEPVEPPTNKVIYRKPNVVTVYRNTSVPTDEAEIIRGTQRSKVTF